MKQALLVIKIGIIALVASVVLRLAGYHNANPIPPVGTTPGAIHRLADTIFLLGIALSLVEIHRVLGRGKEPVKPKQDETKE